MLSGRNSFPQLVIQYQMAIPENIYTSYIIQTEQVVFMYLGMYTRTHTCPQQQLKRDYEFENEQEGGIGRFRGRKEKEEMM